MVRAYYQLFLHDKNGKLVWKSRKRRSKSFVLQWLQAIMTQMKQGGLSFKVRDGTTKTSQPYATNLAVTGGAGDSEKGIVVGTGTGAEANDNYCLGALIAHGTGAGQLQYGSQAFTDPAIVAGNVDAVLTRAFVNGSGATITVNEIGLHAVLYYGVSPIVPILGIRDVLPAGVAVLNGQTLTVQYTLRTTV